jgi:HEAT repeat protein
MTVRSFALEDLWRLRDPRARVIAMEVLDGPKDTHASLVEDAIRVLATEPDRGTLRALLPWAGNGDNRVWQALYGALRFARDPEVTRALVEGLREPGARTRALCADLLAAMSDPSVPPALLKALAREKDADIAGRLLRALAERDEVSLDALHALARRTDFPARGELLAVLARLGRGDPAVLEIFRSALASRSADERILALDVAAATGDPGLAPAVLANLGHEAWQVRLAAVQALARVRVREAVLPLIERLEREESVRVRAEIGETLFSLTGEDLLDVAGAWRRWWSDRGATFAVPPQPPQRKPETGGTVARFYGLPVKTERVCFVLDRSDSMEGVHAGSAEKRTRLQVAMRELAEAVKRLPDSARVNVVLFDDEVESWKKSLVPLGSANRASLADFLERQVPQRSTNIYDGLEAALLAEGVDTVFLLSDGEPTAGRYRDTRSILWAVRQLNQTRRIAIHTVAVGRDSELLRRLAAESGASYVRR